MQGASGTYGFNNSDFTLQPSTGKWITRTDYGVDGAGHPIYATPRKFQMEWDLISTADTKQLIDLYNTIGNTGTFTACLPEWGNVDYVFKNYSGCTLQEPEVGEYFQTYIDSVRMTILNIRTQ